MEVERQGTISATKKPTGSDTTTKVDPAGSEKQDNAIQIVSDSVLNKETEYGLEKLLGELENKYV